MKRKGFTLVELMTGIGLMSMVLLGLFSVLLYGLRSYQRTTVDVSLSQSNAQGMRRLVETLRAATSITISNEGKTISYQLPQRSTTTDPVTGEKEYLFPVVSDGQARSFTITNGNLVDNQTNRTLVKNISPTDPDPASTQYNQSYQPFQLTTIGSRRAIAINIITLDTVVAQKRYTRMKTTVLVRNSL